MKAAIGTTLTLLMSTLGWSTETPAPALPALRTIKTVNLQVQPLCSFVDFGRAAAVIDADVRKALVKAGIQVVHSGHDEAQPTLAVFIHCDDIRWEGGTPVVGEAPSAMLPEGAGAPFIYLVAAQLSRRLAVPGEKTTESEVVVWSRTGRLHALSKRPFVKLREEILWFVDDFVAEVEKARVTAGP